MRRDELIRRLRELRATQAALEQLEAALDALEEEEREIIDSFYISPGKRIAEKLCEKLLVEVPTVYRRRNKALKKLENFLG